MTLPDQIIVGSYNYRLVALTFAYLIWPLAAVGFTFYLWLLVRSRCATTDTRWVNVAILATCSGIAILFGLFAPKPDKPSCRNVGIRRKRAKNQVRLELIRAWRSVVTTGRPLGRYAYRNHLDTCTEPDIYDSLFVLRFHLGKLEPVCGRSDSI
jgi:hypothetical protein